MKEIILIVAEIINTMHDIILDLTVFAGFLYILKRGKNIDFL